MPQWGTDRAARAPRLPYRYSSERGHGRVRRQRPDAAATDADRKRLYNGDIDRLLVAHPNCHRHRTADRDPDTHPHADTHPDGDRFADHFADGYADGDHHSPHLRRSGGACQ